MEHDMFDVEVDIEGEKWLVSGVLDYVDIAPDYDTEDTWWYIDPYGMLHVQMHYKYKEQYGQLSEKNNENNEESIEFIKSSNKIFQKAAEESMHRNQTDLMCAIKLKTISVEDIESNNALMNAIRIIAHNLSQTEKKRSNRTEKKAGNVAVIPEQIATIIDPRYSNSTRLYQKGKAYLQPLKTVGGLTYQNNTLCIEGIPASEVKLKDYFSDSVPENLDLAFLQLCFSIILNNFEETMEENNTVDQVISIYYPSIAKAIGKSQKISRTDVEYFINKILSFQTIMGIIDKEIQPVLIYAGEDRSRNIIYLSSPYLIKIIRTLFGVSIRRNKQGEPKLKNDGTFEVKQVYSYLINSSIAKERNKKAVENVIMLVTLIEQSGDRTARITAREIIDRNPQLKQALNGKSTAQVNVVLSRTFKKTWELLAEQTRLKEQYKNIKLPSSDIKNIPTKTTLDMEFSFPHDGKNNV